MPSLSSSPRTSFISLAIFHDSKLDEVNVSGNPGFPPLTALVFQSLGLFALLPEKTSDGPLPSAPVDHGVWSLYVNSMRSSAPLDVRMIVSPSLDKRPEY